MRFYVSLYMDSNRARSFRVEPALKALVILPYYLKIILTCLQHLPNFENCFTHYENDKKRAALCDELTVIPN